ncbi:hypothetical protein TBR22_A44950 [Luteitalea sp. TBR-22]|uniref:DUF2339 domain-containing protein n=1 Tax=Luteitalea sp. TBR-22 TaxID=2802971 RepID=UPI001AFCB364|nr:DUF2339 domain-containing protein [Luteitalea sp. TBR-22]BCS35268.1 hypothetical protein TBR22_A44950 [Luteitalea sp. TBR-22]
MDILIGLVFLGASLAVAFVLPVLSFLRASQATRRAEALGREVAALRAEVEALRAAGPPPAPHEADEAARAAWASQVRDMAAPPPPTTDGLSVPPPVPLPVPLPPGTMLDERGAVIPDPRESTAARESATAAGMAGLSPMPGQEAAALPGGVHDTSAPPDGGTAPGEHPGAHALPGSTIAPAATTPEGLEERIGARWLLYAGIGALILGVSYFIKFAFDNGWVSEPLRVLIGLGAGAALVAVGQRFVRNGLAFFGHALSGGGLVVLYVAIYAALHVYELVSPGTAFGAMVLVTALGVVLADRHRVEMLGALAVLGGFLTPALVGGGQDRQVVLFLYNALLLAGVLLMVWRHAWAGVALLGPALAAAMSVAWAAQHYAPAAGLRTLLLLTIHLVLVSAIIAVLRTQRTRTALAVPVSWILLAAPVLYHVAALWLIGRAHGQFLVYLLLVTVAGLSASYHAGWRWARTVLLVLVALPFIDWMGELVTPRFHTGGVVTACALYLLHLAGQWRDLSDDDPQAPVPVAELVHTHATGVFLPLALYAFFAEHAAWWNAPMLTVLAAWNLGLWAVVRSRIPVLSWQFVALAGTLAAVAISEWFEGPVVAIGWALEGAALGYAALQSRSPWLDRGALVLFVMAAMRLAEALVAPMPVGTWPIVNTRTLAAIVVIAAMAWLAARAKDAPDHFGGPMARHALVVGANVLAIGWISSEIVLVFGQRALAASTDDRPADVARAELAEQVALSVSWALYAVGLVAAGFWRAYAPARYLAIALFGLTLVKVMTKDIAELDRVYQMLSVLGVGALLVAASYLYQRVAAARRDDSSRGL